MRLAAFVLAFLAAAPAAQAGELSFRTVVTFGTRGERGTGQVWTYVAAPGERNAVDVEGGEGDDRLTGAGDLAGGPGADELRSAGGSAMLKGGPGPDVLDPKDGGGLDYSERTTGVSVNLAGDAAAGEPGESDAFSRARPRSGAAPGRMWSSPPRAAPG